AIARREGLEYRRRGGLAGREQYRRGRTLERGDQRLGLIVTGVVGARVSAPAGERAVRPALVGRRDIDRRHDVAVRLRDLAHALSGEGFGMELGLVSFHGYHDEARRRIEPGSAIGSSGSAA